MGLDLVMELKCHKESGGFRNLPDVFLRAIRQDEGVDPHFDDSGRLYFSVFQYWPNDPNAAARPPALRTDPDLLRGAHEHLWVNALLDILRNDGHAKARLSVLRILAPHAHRWLEQFRDELLVD